MAAACDRLLFDSRFAARDELAGWRSWIRNDAGCQCAVRRAAGCSCVATEGVPDGRRHLSNIRPGQRGVSLASTKPASAANCLNSAIVKAARTLRTASTWTTWQRVRTRLATYARARP